MQAMYDLVGDKIQEIFDAQVVDIAIYDATTDLIHFPYTHRARRALPGRADAAHRLPAARLRDASAAGHQRRRGGARPSGTADRSWSPGSSRKSCRLRAAASSATRRPASSRSRTSTARTPSARPTCGSSTTLAASLSVALENARLFDETQRLLAETDERAAELAIINSVQQGLAARARHAGDVRPRRRQDPGDLRRPGRRHRRRTTSRPGSSASRTRSSAACGCPETTIAPDRLPQARLRDRPAPASSTTSRARRRRATAIQPVIVGEPPQSVALRPAHRRRATSAACISLQNLDRTDAFSEADVRLLTTLAASLSVALENARLVDETRQRAAELAIVNEVGQAAATPARPRRADRARRRASCAITFDADIVYVALLDADDRRRSSSRTTGERGSAR